MNDPRISRRHLLISGAMALASTAMPGGIADARRHDKPLKPRWDFRPDRSHDPFRAPLGHGKKWKPRGTPVSGGGLGTGANVLVLYDTTNDFGWLGEIYAMMTANLVSHFGTWTAKPVTSYTAGMMTPYTAVVYVGSTYDEPLPVAFLDDVLAGQKPVFWLRDNIWQLTARWATLNPGGSFAAAYGWMWAGFDTSAVAEILYKGTSLRRYVDNGAGILDHASADPSVVLAWAVRGNGSRFPWAVRSRNLTYLGENPFVFIVEGDRLLAFEDLLFDVLAPATPERHRALIRLEDISPASEPAKLREVADYLASRGVPFGFGVSPRYRDPLGHHNGGTPRDFRLREVPDVVRALKYLQARGGVMVTHGWTHQYGEVANPYNGVTGDDFEFYRVVENPDHTLAFVGPVPEDSRRWALHRLDSAAWDFVTAGLRPPSIFEFPHYAASAVDYQAVNERYDTRWERSFYFSGLLTGGTIDHARLAGQRFSYVVRDVYGMKVLPENLGSIEPEPFFQFPTRFPADILGDAARVRVIRDGFASFYFHPFLDIGYLKETVEGLQAAGWEFVSPSSL